MKHKILHAIKKPKVYIPIIVLVLILTFLFRGKSTEDQTLVLHAGTFAQQVSVAGKVIPAEDVNLGFEGGGKVAGVYVKVGDKVNRGQLIASISNADLQANLLQRQAKLEAEEAKLADLKKGKRPEEIAVSQSAVASAEASLEQARESLADTISDTYTTAEDIVHNKIDQFMSNGRSDNPKINFVVTESSQKYDIESGRVKIEATLKLWQNLVAALSDTKNTSASVTEVQLYLASLNAYLLKVSTIVNIINPDSNLFISQTTIDKYKSDISNARTTLRASIAAVTSGDTQVRNAQTALVIASNKLKLDQAGYVQEDIDAQMAEVKAAQADVASVQAMIGKTVIVAPFSGLVTKMDLNAGEIVSSGNSEVSLISSARFEIESFVPEVNIASVKIKNNAKVTLDAYGDGVTFNAVLTEINPAETIKDGVSTYKIKLQFTADDERIRPGMTANITISTDSREGVLAVSPKALIKKDGKTYVVVKNNDDVEEKEVTTGSVSFDGMVEIVNGLHEGDTVVIKAIK